MKVLLQRNFFDHKNFLWKKSESARDFREMPDDFRDKLPKSAQIMEGPDADFSEAPAPALVIDDGMTAAEEMDRALARAEANQQKGRAELDQRLAQVQKSPAKAKKVSEAEEREIALEQGAALKKLLGESEV